MRTESLAEADVPQVYLSLYQTFSHHLAIFVRGQLDPPAIEKGVLEQVQSVDGSLPVYGAQRLEETVSASLSQRRFSLEMVVLFALTALLLACIGIYGVISYMVTARTHEIGIRLALGAGRSDIVRMVLHQGVRLAVAGAAVGLIASEGPTTCADRGKAGAQGERRHFHRPFPSASNRREFLAIVGESALSCIVPAVSATSEVQGGNHARSA